MTTPPQPQSSPAARPWPVGVPELLFSHNPDRFIVFSLHNHKSQHRGPAWKRLGTWYEPRDASNRAEQQPRAIPRVVISMKSNAIVYSNAAARALGIVPDGETK